MPTATASEPIISQQSAPASTSGVYPPYSEIYAQTIVRKRSCAARLGRIDSESEPSEPYLRCSPDDAPSSTLAPTAEESSRSGGMSAAMFGAARSLSADAPSTLHTSASALALNRLPSRFSGLGFSPRERERERYSSAFGSGSGLLKHQHHRLSTRDLSSFESSTEAERCERCGWPREAEAAPMGRLSRFDTGSHAGSTASLFMSGLDDECFALHVPPDSNPNISHTDDEGQTEQQHQSQHVQRE